MRFPARRFRGLAHVGDLTTTSRVHRGVGASYEGFGLSVSLHPEAWSDIARAGGRTWLLRRKDKKQGRFVDMRRLTKKTKSALLDEAERAGLGKRIPIWQSCYYDSEQEDWLCTDWYKKKDAENDAAYYYKNEEDTDAKVKASVGWKSSTTFKRQWRKTFKTSLPLGMAEDQALLTVMASHNTHDGAWWDETFDPGNLSAPRGVIFEKAQPQWDRCALNGPKDKWSCSPAVTTRYCRDILDGCD